MRRLACLLLLLQAFAGCLGEPAPAPEGPTPEEPVPTVPTGGTPPLPLVDAGATLRFTLNDSYVEGEGADVTVRNEGNETYGYNPYYQACSLTYEDASGRRFKIPPGTHCDLIGWQPIRPNETVRLFRWQLDECVVDNWGCAESRPLPPGEYRIQGALHPWNEGRGPQGNGTTIEARFRIVAAQKEG